ncbi:hypothetical protein [Ancylobacter mangrovi]|uniref:hypothetical protein n=1 Tax=Ancylobacter mangrovi TaxID=2972472 RepID=UPI002163FC52|nr:hypothetical protein [Ancylobacter mangrovi]MCS0504576.1 hypothetical protein [Ancylobacter mangrovi]
MTERLMALLAFLVLAGFLSILVIWVPRVDLGAWVLLTLVCAGYDMIDSHRGQGTS